MTITNERIKEIFILVDESIKNAEKQENETAIKNCIVDSIYWINTYQLINRLEDELKEIDSFLTPNSEDHFIDDIRVVRARLRSACASKGIDLNNGQGVTVKEAGGTTLYNNNNKIVNFQINNPGVTYNVTTKQGYVNTTPSSSSSSSVSTGPKIILSDTASCMVEGTLCIIRNKRKNTFNSYSPDPELILFHNGSNTPITKSLSNTGILGFTLSGMEKVSIIGLDNKLYLYKNTAVGNTADDTRIYSYDLKLDQWDVVVNTSFGIGSHVSFSTVWENGVEVLLVAYTDFIKESTEFFTLSTSPGAKTLIKRFDLPLTIYWQHNLTKQMPYGGHISMISKKSINDPIELVDANIGINQLPSTKSVVTYSPTVQTMSCISVARGVDAIYLYDSLVHVLETWEVSSSSILSTKQVSSRADNMVHDTDNGKLYFVGNNQVCQIEEYDIVTGTFSQRY